MAENVVAMPGFSVPRSQSEPIPEVVAVVEELLALARTGVLRGIGAALVVADPQMRTETRLFSGPSPDRYALIAAVSHLRYMTDVCSWPDLAAGETDGPAAG